MIQEKSKGKTLCLRTRLVPLRSFSKVPRTSFKPLETHFYESYLGFYKNADQFEHEESMHVVRGPNSIKKNLSKKANNSKNASTYNLSSYLQRFSKGKKVGRGLKD
jgi:hypothetical protein